MCMSLHSLHFFFFVFYFVFVVSVVVVVRHFEAHLYQCHMNE